MSKDVKTSSAVGCIEATIGLLCTMPIRASLTFWVLSELNAPTWCWVGFWVYVPVAVLLGGLSWLAKEAARKGD